MDYRSFVFNSAPDGFPAPEVKLSSFHWEQEGYSRPETFASLWAVENSGIYARIYSFEDSPLCRFTERDSPVWTDSCVEVFLAPVPGDKRYMNFEMNPNGAFLCQFGEKRENRVFIKELTDIAPQVKPFSFGKDGKTAWGCLLFIHEELVSALYGIEFKVGEGEMSGNFYKCADDSSSPHYEAYFPVDSAALGFHNPARFGRIILSNK